MTRQPRQQVHPEEPPEVVRERFTTLTLQFLRQSRRKGRQVKRLFVLRQAPEGLAGRGVAVGANLEALSRLYNRQEVVLVGFDSSALRRRWAHSPVRAVEALPPAQPGDRWVYYDPAALEGEGAWRLLDPLVYGPPAASGGVPKGIVPCAGDGARGEGSRPAVREAGRA